MTFSASICKNNEIILFLDQIFIVGNTCPWFKQYLCIGPVKQNYVYVITRSDGKKMLIFILKSNDRGGGGNSHLILVRLCRRYFSDPPYSCIPDCRNVYLFMYDLYSFATHRYEYFYAMLIYQPYRCIEMGNLATYCY